MKTYHLQSAANNKIFSVEDLNKRILQSMEDSRKGNLIAVEDLKAKLKRGINFCFR